MTKAMVISADGHVAPAQLADYRPYIEQRYLEAFDEHVKAAEEVTVNFDSVVDPKVIAPYKEAMFDSGAIEGKWNPGRRLKEVASEGIAAEVLFPDGAPFSAGGIGADRVRFSPELELVGGRAYNRWLSDYVSDTPERYAGQAIISLPDIDAAVADVYWAKEHGLRGLVMPGMEDGYPRLWHPCYEPFWAACEETALPINFHGGIALPDYGEELAGVPQAVRIRIQISEFPWFAHRPLWWLIWSGVLERHPGLKVVFTEQHSDWVASVLAQMDHSYDHSMFDDAIKAVVPRRPSDYWTRQCYLGSSLLARGELQNRDQIGAANMMFGADFPHPEGTCMDTLKYLQATVGMAGMSEAEAQAFLGGTAAEVFGLDTVPLQPIVAKYGFELDDIRTPLAAEYEYMFDRKDVVRPVVWVR
jgi:predicted TIM-barrel fold metal-dependent hydrolase